MNIKTRIEKLEQKHAAPVVIHVGLVYEDEGIVMHKGQRLTRAEWAAVTAGDSQHIKIGLNWGDE